MTEDKNILYEDYRLTEHNSTSPLIFDEEFNIKLNKSETPFNLNTESKQEISVVYSIKIRYGEETSDTGFQIGNTKGITWDEENNPVVKISLITFKPNLTAIRANINRGVILSLLFLSAFIASLIYIVSKKFLEKKITK